jgi:homoserine acetyltransferase
MTSLSIHPAGLVPELPGKRLDFGDWRLPLDCGAELTGVTLAYQTYGTLNADKSNAILITHFFSANSHAAGKY